MMQKTIENPSSFRDPSGFIFHYKNNIYRQVNYSYKDNYDLLIRSGLYKKLIDLKYLVSHQETEPPVHNKTAYKILKPVKIPFISYSYDWCFGQLKDAALLTLKIQKIALDYGMSLKDANCFNVQFLNGRPILIDSLSFEKYEEGRPWVAYKQFCEQFLSPLALASFKDIGLVKLLQTNINGIPLQLTAKLLPAKCRINPALLIHIFLHTRSQIRNTKISIEQKRKQNFNINSFRGLIGNLRECIEKLNWDPGKTLWSGYYENTDGKSYQDSSFKEKKSTVAKYLNLLNPKSVWDIGANTGEFSKIAADKGIFTVSIDSDPLAVEKNYLWVKKNKAENNLPLWIDITNPSPDIGWENRERLSLLSRPHPDTILSLALIHHLVIGNNIPILKIAGLFSKLCKSLIIEFIPKDDPKVKLLLQNREDIFSDYTQENFENQFGKYFVIKDVLRISGSKRTLYLMINK